MYVFVQGVNACLFLTVNTINEYKYWEYSVRISIFLKTSLQVSLALVLDKTRTVRFCSINNLVTLDDLPQKIMP